MKWLIKIAAEKVKEAEEIINTDVELLEYAQYLMVKY